LPTASLWPTKLPEWGADAIAIFPKWRICSKMTPMRVLADERKVASLIEELADAIRQDMQRCRDGTPWALVGVRSRGDLLAERLAARLHPDHVGTLDLTLYRDDLSEISPQVIVRTTEIPFCVDGVNIVLVDDVLMTGRSVRAALQSLMDLGRPQRVWLAVLVDRGGRELPIAPDHVGFIVSRDMEGGLHRREIVDVYLRPTDDRDEIVVATAGQRAIEGTGRG